MTTTKSSLIAEHGRLVDQKYLGTLSDAGAARLAHIRQEIDRLDAPKIKRLKRSLDHDLGRIDGQIAAFEAKIAESGASHTKTKTAGLP